MSRFPRAVRLTGSAQFQRVFKQARVRSADAIVTVLAVKNDGPSARLGMAISRKVAPRAIDRNRIKRVIRESFRNNINSLYSYDVVIIGRPGIAGKSNNALRESLQHHWKLLGI